MVEQSNSNCTDDQRPVIIFGNELSASLAWYCLVHDSPCQVAAFTVDQAFLTSPRYNGLPVVAFESLEDYYPPTNFRLIIPMGYQQINGLRRARFEEAKRRGYEYINYISSRASVWDDLVIGENVLIYEHAIIQPFSKIGDNCIIRSGAHISHHCTIEDHAFIAAEVAMGGKVYIGEQSFIGVGATLRDGIKIGSKSFVGAGAVVMKDTKEGAVYIGNPARRTGKTVFEASS